MFSVILKNLHKENIDFNKLNEFLNEVVQRPFFKAHDDYNYDKILNLLSSMATYETDEYKGWKKKYLFLDKISIHFNFKIHIKNVFVFVSLVCTKYWLVIHSILEHYIDLQTFTLTFLMKKYILINLHRIKQRGNLII